MKSPRILPLHIGGTIASSASSSGLKPKLSFMDLLNRIDKGIIENYFIAEALSPFGEHGIDSASMQLPNIQKIADMIRVNYDEYDGFVITHGTDTLAYTASMLAFMLRGIQKTVIVTGAQRTLEDKNSDVVSNLETALLAAVTPNCGVWVAFNESVIKAVRSTKNDISVNCSDAFISNIRDEIHIFDFQRNDYAVNKGQMERFSTKVSDAVDIFCLTHTTDAVCLKNYLDNSNCKALIVLIYGMSGHRIELIDVLSRWAAGNGTVVIAKAHPTFGSTDLSKYELGVDALKMGIISSLDMTLESTYAKTCHLFAQGIDLQEFCNQFYSNYCGEIDEAGVKKFRIKANYWLSTL